MSDSPTESSETPSRKRITPIDVQQQVFRRAFLRGYNEQEVDDFLDELTEELAALLEEQRKLREQLQTGVTETVGGTGDLSEAKRLADDIVLRAREEAAEILRAARTEAAASAGGGSSGLQPFLGQERAFLQDLSRLIQGHAEAVRDMARARRASSESGGPAQSSPPPEPEATPTTSDPAVAEEPQPDEVTVVEPEEASAQSGGVKELFYGED